MLYHLDGDAKLSLSMVSNNYGAEHCQLGFYTQQAYCEGNFST